jgi:hypothetical protein
MQSIRLRKGEDWKNNKQQCAKVISNYGTSRFRETSYIYDSLGSTTILGRNEAGSQIQYPGNCRGLPGAIQQSQLAAAAVSRRLPCCVLDRKQITGRAGTLSHDR